jgi:hypothetical protein
LHTCKLAANGYVLVNYAGNLIRYHAGTPDVLIELDADRIFPLSKGDQVEGLQPAYDRFKVTNMSGALASVDLLVGFAQRYVPGPERGAGGGGAAATPVLASTYFRQSSVNTLATIVTPAANVNGVRILFWFAQHAAGGASQRIMAKSSAPSAWNDAAANTVGFCYNGASCLGAAMPIDIPAGLGLYEQSSNGANVSTAIVEYAVL